MSNHSIETLAEESLDLALHVKLCEQRYAHLNESIAALQSTLDEIRDGVELDNKNTLKTYLGWSGFIIAFLSGALLHIVFK